MEFRFRTNVFNISDHHYENRMSYKNSQWACIQLRELIGYERARNFAILAIRFATNEHGQVCPFKLEGFLMSVLANFKEDE